jgi:hypothetical protein
MRFRGMTLAFGAICAAAALTGCGVSKVFDPVAAAATKTENAGGAKMTTTISVAEPGAGKTFTIDAQGVFDKDQADMTMDLSSLLGGTGLSLPAGSGNVEMRYLQESGDPVMYMNIPFLATLLPNGKSWIKLDLEKAGKSLGVDFNELANESNQNPAQTLDLLRAAGTVDKVGSETVNGVATTHYSATVDLQKATARLGAAGAALAKKLAAAGITSVPVDVWIGDDDGLVHRMTMNESITRGGKSVTTAVTMNILSYGVGVTVIAPPADQVLDATTLATNAAAQHAVTA